MVTIKGEGELLLECIDLWGDVGERMAHAGAPYVGVATPLSVTPSCGQELSQSGQTTRPAVVSEIAARVPAA
jgi:hypothetical protein